MLLNRLCDASKCSRRNMKDCLSVVSLWMWLLRATIRFTCLGIVTVEIRLLLKSIYSNWRKSFSGSQLMKISWFAEMFSWRSLLHPISSMPLKRCNRFWAMLTASRFWHAPNTSCGRMPIELIDTSKCFNFGDLANASTESFFNPTPIARNDSNWGNLLNTSSGMYSNWEFSKMISFSAVARVLLSMTSFSRTLIDRSLHVPACCGWTQFNGSAVLVACELTSSRVAKILWKEIMNIGYYKIESLTTYHRKSTAFNCIARLTESDCMCKKNKQANCGNQHLTDSATLRNSLIRHFQDIIKKHTQILLTSDLMEGL